MEEDESGKSKNKMRLFRSGAKLFQKFSIRDERRKQRVRNALNNRAIKRLKPAEIIQSKARQ